MSNPLNGNINGMQFNGMSNQPANGITPQMQQSAAHIKNIMGMLKSSGNPQATIQQVAQNNPQLNQVMQLCNGKNPEQVFRQMCADRGINADEFIKMLQ